MFTRFAPSPTGLIHIGNVRSAILNWAFAKKNNGKFILRIDDTDNERSKKKYEDLIKNNLHWLGLDWDITFNQSSRQNLYEEKIKILKDSKRLYPCFETPEELSLKKKSLLSSGKPPIYDRSSLNLTAKEIKQKISEGIKPHWRFKLEDKIIKWNDLLKGEVSFDSKKLSDPVLIRENGSLLYHLPSVIDDISENITDIIRGEDHLSNTAYHIQIFEALNSNIPNFAHHPFLTDEQGKGFSKRIGSLSIESLKDEDFESITILNYLINIGSSNDLVAEKNIENLIKNFSLKNISSASPKFSKEVLTNLNKNTLKNFNVHEVSSRISVLDKKLSQEMLWKFSKNNINFFSEIKIFIDIIKSKNNIVNNNINSDFLDVAIETLPSEPYDEETWEKWTNLIKEKTNLKGKELYLPLRIALTGQDKGPEMKYLLPLLNKQNILEKFGKI